LKRGNVVTVAAGGGFGGKPWPALIIQDDDLAELETIVVALFTSSLTDAPDVRMRFEPSAENGLLSPSDLMTEILSTVRRDRVGKVIGHLGRDDMARVDRRLVALLGLAG
jgi:mRNA interferase MazF